MRALPPEELLQVWERGQSQPPLDRPLTALAAALPDIPPESLARAPIGWRDAWLLALRELTFGRTLTGLVDCPDCGGRVELQLDIAELRTAAGAQADPDPAAAAELTMAIDGYEVRCHLPNSLDLRAAAEEADAQAARQRLLERCVSASLHGEAVALLPPDVTSAVVARMAQADSQADIGLSLDCPSCGHCWRPILDIGAYFWAELGAWAIRTLREVDVLARAYGWREAEILALSPARRRAYLELASA
jgi:hypothetical protein